MSVPITSSLLTSKTGYPIPTAFTSGSTICISVVDGPAYITVESRRQSGGMYTSSANFGSATLDSRSPTFSNIVDTSIVSGDFITAATVGSKNRTGSLDININRDLPANELFLKVESADPSVSISGILNSDSFAFNIKTDNAGTSNNDQFLLPLHTTFGSGGVTSSVDWGDGTTSLISSSLQSEKTHTYPSSGEYFITMTPTTGTVGITGFTFDSTGGDHLKMLRIENFGSLSNSRSYTFFECANLTVTAPDNLTISTTNPQFGFNGCTNLTSLDVTRWDISSATNIGFMFTGCENLVDFDASNWDTSNITNMNAIFKKCALVDFSLASWDIGSATNIKNLFQNQGGVTTAGISTPNYDATLIGWASASNTPNNLITDFGISKYTGTFGSEASASREILIGKGWTITDGGVA